ncbi:putative late blight resistance protein-like protein R1B-17 [Forsythia ovata]|uniref:Late blight resistance protein-like protein R1B-17 n=1 Tax=Forsythia ovata TaxID=205694 RepID=A0ABD1TUR1_9LAMI
MDDESLVEALCKSLIKLRYLIVVDDIWDMNSWNDFGRYFPNDKNGSRILFTTRRKEVGLQASHHSVVNELPILSDVECWELLQRKVYQKEYCPQELVDIGKQIAMNCQGLPLAVIVIAAVLEKIEMKEHLWHKVATSMQMNTSKTNNMHGRLLVTIDHFHLEPEILNSLFFLKIYLFHTLPSLPSMGIHRPVLTSLASQILENPDFQDFWYYELIKNKKFETFPGHARLIQIAFEINLKFSSRGKVIYLLKNLEDSALNCLSESRPDYKKHFKLLLVLLQEFGEEFAAPKLVMSKRSPAIFIDFLRQIIEAILNIEPDFIFSVKGSIDTLRNKVDFLITFTGDTLSLQPSEVRFNLFTSIEAVLKEVGSFLYSFFFVRDPILAPRMDLELSYLLRKFELIEANIKEHCIAVSNMPSRTTRKTAVVSFFIVDSLLDDLTDLLNHKADKIVGVNDQILTLHDELMFLRSSLTVTDITLHQHAELEELVTQTANIAYEIEYVIN